MVVKKSSPVLHRKQSHELEVLYQRRRAIDSLIASLQHYDRFRAKVPGIHELRGQKSA